MIHANPYNHQAIILLPQELQNLWLSSMLYPAIGKAMANYPGISEYLPSSPEQLCLKDGAQSLNESIPVNSSALETIIHILKQQIKDEPELLSRFGSFFFVLDAHDIKFLSKQQPDEETAFEVLKKLVSALDWNHMLDCQHGELYLDLGISYHVKADSGGEPIVGLWQMEPLNKSYDLMGSEAVTNYNFGTMWSYGGKKAAMYKSVAYHCHLTKRISYNLCWEVVHQSGQQQYLCSDNDGLQVNSTYLSACKKWLKLFRDAKERSYGVRDEL